jgi:hypothetical protein
LGHAGLDDNFAGRFDGAAANGQAKVAEVGIAHALALMKEIEDGLSNRVGEGLTARVEEADLVKEGEKIALGPVFLLLLHPGGGLIAGDCRQDAAKAAQATALAQCWLPAIHWAGQPVLEAKVALAQSLLRQMETLATDLPLSSGAEDGKFA